MSDEKKPENRKYVRLPEPFPVEFTIVRLQGDLPGIDWVKGVTRNVSRGGLCLETTAISESMIRFLSQMNIYLEVRVFFPLKQTPIKTVCDIVWYDREEGSGKFVLGLQFRSILADDLNQLLRYAQVMVFSARSLIWISIAVLGAIMALNFLGLR